MLNANIYSIITTPPCSGTFNPPPFSQRVLARCFIGRRDGPSHRARRNGQKLSFKGVGDIAA